MECSTALELCKSIIETLKNASTTSSIKHFQELVTVITDVIEMSPEIIKKKIVEVEANIYKNALNFQFSQLLNSMQFLATIISEEHMTGLYFQVCRRSICRRLYFCLETICDTFGSNNLPPNLTGCYLKWIDNSLEKITEINLDAGKLSVQNELKEVKLLFEDVLVYAMSVAQVCLKQDKIAITGSCQIVLESLEELQSELNKNTPNNAMVNLFIDNSGDKLCSLERKIDTSILRLCLNIFSKYLIPLENVVKFCIENCETQPKHSGVHDIIAEFDLHVDRIMQIGLFAVYCSSSEKNAINIRNHMASLEFLETELIPAILMLLCENSKINYATAMIYRNYWISEANKLKRLIFDIVDPSTFCQVICDEIGAELDRLREKLKNDEYFGKSEFLNIIAFGEVFVKFTTTAIASEDMLDEISVNERIIKCSFMLNEINKTVDVLDDHSTETNNRIWKRCKVFKAEMKKLISLLKHNDLDRDKENPVSHENIKNDLEKNKFLNHLMAKGKTILQNRSILYRTPKNSMFQTALSCHTEKGKVKTVDSFIKRLSTRKLNFSFDCTNDHANHNHTFQLHLTEVLSNLSNLQIESTS